MMIEIPRTEIKNSDVYNRDSEWVKKAIFAYLKSSGYSFPRYFVSDVEVSENGTIITIIEKPQPEKESKPSPLSSWWSWLKCSVLRVAG